MTAGVPTHFDRKPGDVLCLPCLTLCAARCWGVYTGTLLAFCALTAQALVIPAGQTGTVAVIQRFGSGLQLNLHFHTLALARPRASGPTT